MYLPTKFGSHRNLKSGISICNSEALARLAEKGEEEKGEEEEEHSQL